MPVAAWQEVAAACAVATGAIGATAAATPAVPADPQPQAVNRSRQAASGSARQRIAASECAFLRSLWAACSHKIKSTGARRGNRTHTVSPPPDFESGASTSSAIRACQTAQYIRLLGRSAHLVVFIQDAAHRLPLRSSAGADRAAARDAAFREPVARPRRRAGRVRGSRVSRPTDAFARRRPSGVQRHARHPGARPRDQGKRREDRVLARAGALRARSAGARARQQGAEAAGRRLRCRAVTARA